MASGGLVGTGLGQGSPTLIPYVGSDFIFAAFGEELGMLGAAGLLLLYLVLIGRGLRIAIERTDAFGKLLATGLTTIVALQTFAIVGGVTRLDPAHRRAAAARLVRRVEPRGDLRDARAAGARLRRARGSESTWIGRSAGSGSRSSLLFGLLFAQLAYVQVFAADRISERPGERAAARSSPSTRSSAGRSSRRRAGRWPRASARRAEADYLYERTYPDGPALRGDHGLLLAGLRTHRARARR